MELTPLRCDESERATVGAVLLGVDNEAIDAALSEGVTSDDFTDARLRAIFGAAVGLTAQQAAVDATTVKAALVASGKLQCAGGDAFLGELLAVPATVCNVRHYAKIVKHKARLRALHSTAQQAAVSLSRGEDMAAVRASLEGALQDTLPASASDAGQIGSLLRSGVGLARANSLPWGLASLDRRLGGLPEASLVVIGAYPSTGKTSLITQVLCGLARAGTPIAFFSCEMSAAQVLSTMVGRESGVGAARLRAVGARGLSEADAGRVGAAALDLSSIPFYLIAGRLSAEEIAAHARAHARKHGVKVIAVDYLQLLKREGGEESRRIGIDASVNALKALAQSTGLAVVLLSQLSRGDARNPQPASSLLKESGGIMEAADTVVILDRPRFRQFAACPECRGDRGRLCAECGGDGTVSTDDEMTLAIEKNRFGDVGSVSLHWDGRAMRVSDRS